MQLSKGGWLIGAGLAGLLVLGLLLARPGGTPPVAATQTETAALYDLATARAVALPGLPPTAVPLPGPLRTATAAAEATEIAAYVVTVTSGELTKLANQFP